MDRNFNKSLQLVLKSEGGFVNLKADPGGATNLGITLANFRAYIEPTGTIDDLKNLTAEQAGVCYRREYWDAVAGDDLPDGVDYATMDFAVNSGPSRAAKYLQATVGVAQDGSIGPATIAAVKAKPAGVTIDALCDARLAYLKRIKDDKGNLLWLTFGKGWSSRVASVRRDALLMSGQGTGSPPMAQQPVQPPQPAPAPVPAPEPAKVETPPAAAPETMAPPQPGTRPASEPPNPAAQAPAAGFLAALIAIILKLFGRK